MADQNEKPAQPAQEPIHIPVDAPVPDDDIDALVRDYEEKYYEFREKESRRIRAATVESVPAPKAKRSMPLVRTSSTSDDERTWAAIAHGSALLTFLVGGLTGGLAVLFMLFIPLGIYFAYRQRSEYVAYHALQAFALQVLCTVGWLAILVGGMVLGALLCVILAITIIGIPLVIVVALAMALLAVGSLALPFGMPVFGALAAWKAYRGEWYRYPRIGDWIDRQMHGGFLRT
jgi:uncharacterized Tic20 family protein